MSPPLLQYRLNLRDLPDYEYNRKQENDDGIQFLAEEANENETESLTKAATAIYDAIEIKGEQQNEG